MGSMKPTTGDHRIAGYLLLSGLTAVMLWQSPPAAAQNALGTGRGMESNLQQGGTYRNDGSRPRNSMQGNAIGNGRVLENRLFQSPNYDNRMGGRRPGAYQDAIVTGNAGGLSRFRGEIDYGAAGEFRDSVGGTEVFDFNRQSLPGAGGTGGRGRGGLASPSFGQGGDRGGGIGGAGAVGGGIIQRPGGGVTGGQITGQSQPFGGLREAGRVDATGFSATRRRGGDITAELDARQPYSRQTLGIAANVDGQMLRVDASPLTGLTTRTMRRPDTLAGGGGLAADRMGGLAQRPDAMAAPSDGTQTDGSDRPGRVSGSRMGAQRLTGERVGASSRLDVQPLGRDSRLTRDGRPAAAGREAEDDQPSFDVDPGDAYRNLLDQIRRQTGADIQPGATEDVFGGRQASDRARADDGAAGRVGAADQGDRPRRGSVEDLVYDLPSMESFAGRTDSLFNQAIRKAEQSMRDGAYFRAERAYQEALQYKPEHPLASIGRVHARLGAGLHRSAGQALRAVLAGHPELAAAKYAFPVLPESGRLAVLSGQLEDRVENDPDDAHAALLRAYLAHQAGEVETASQYLEIFQQRAPRDPLGRLLHRVWIDGAEAGQDDRPADDAALPAGAGQGPDAPDAPDAVADPAEAD